MDESPDRPASALVIGERRALRDDVRDAIVKALLGGEFHPGERIVETRLARQLGVSQTTVREALREIEQLGMVVSVPNRGVLVRPLTRRGAIEMYEMRALLEGQAARLAAERLRDQDVDELEALAHDMVRLAEAGDLREMIMRDVAFHARICQLADHALLARLWSAVNPHLWTYVAVSGLLGLSPRHVAERHFAVVQALRSRDPERAERALHEHLLEMRDAAAEKLPDAPSNGDPIVDPLLDGGRGFWSALRR